ncbi:MAG: hypothetical protein JO256_03170 [Alphaproteobacteria bacterium]|nr:hypothetical protein [Alphaproteobacteria bacterium]
MSDAGVPTLTSLKIENPHLRDAAAFIGEISRPVSILIVSFGACVATITIAQRITGDGTGAGFFIGAVFAGLAALYWGKAMEKIAQIKQGAQ